MSTMLASRATTVGKPSGRPAWPIVLALLLTILFPHGLQAASFSLQQLVPSGPLSRVQIWAPPQGSSGNYPVLFLLHGMQGPTANPNWFIELRNYSPFNQAILVVPAVDNATRWDAPDIVNTLKALLEKVTTSYPADPRRVYLVGFSAGASRGFQVAAALKDRLAAFVALAGLPPAAGALELRSLQSIRVILVCMELDKGGGSCSNQPAAADRLSRAGVTVERRTIAGLGHDCNFSRVAPVLAEGLKLGGF